MSQIQVDEKPYQMPPAGTHLLVATGRRPNTDDLGLDKADITTDSRVYPGRRPVAYQHFRHLGDGTTAMVEARSRTRRGMISRSWQQSSRQR